MILVWAPSTVSFHPCKWFFHWPSFILRSALGWRLQGSALGMCGVSLSPLHLATCKPQEPLLLWVSVSVPPTWVTPLTVPLPRNSLSVGRRVPGRLAPSVSIPQGLLCLFTQILISSESFSYFFWSIILVVSSGRVNLVPLPSCLETEVASSDFSFLGALFY